MWIVCSTLGEQTLSHAVLNLPKKLVKRSVEQNSPFCSKPRLMCRLHKCDWRGVDAGRPHRVLTKYILVEGEFRLTQTFSFVAYRDGYELFLTRLRLRPTRSARKVLHDREALRSWRALRDINPASVRDVRNAVFDEHASVSIRVPLLDYRNWLLPDYAQTARLHGSGTPHPRSALPLRFSSLQSNLKKQSLAKNARHAKKTMFCQRRDARLFPRGIGI